ncbi:Transcriptional regulator, AcrR family [hydrothermal vent metagenome]|uniref:Transcriptional regulator, AcrR family n=1 Tax=hydrothermal vent metagenome TaxID=652676 RepID=A0A3B0TT71_9ZZZZ
MQSPEESKSITARQGEVLEAALALLVRQGSRLTMAGVAEKAACSKETLYKWFGDRKGLLRATVKWQAAKVGMPHIEPGNLDAASLKNSIEGFGRDLLTVLTGEISVALNRVAIAHAGPEGANLGAIVLENGRLAMGRRLKPVLEAGQKAGLLTFADSEEAFRSFFGLLIRDTQIRLLLGDHCAPDTREIAIDAARATGQFYVLYGTEKNGGKPQT